MNAVPTQPQLPKNLTQVPENIPENPRALENALREATKKRDQVAQILRGRTGQTLVARMIRCGNSRCQCTTNPAFRHGPYLYVKIRKGGKNKERYLGSDWHPSPRVMPPEEFEALRDLYFAWVRRVHELRAALGKLEQKPTQKAPTA